MKRKVNTHCSHKSVPSINLEVPQLKFTSSRVVGCKKNRTQSNQALCADQFAWILSPWFPNQILCPCLPFLRQPHLHCRPCSISMSQGGLLILRGVLAHLVSKKLISISRTLSLLTFFCPCSPSSVLAHLLLSLLTFFCPCSPSSVLAHLLLSLLTFFCPCSPSSVLAHLLLPLLTFFCPCSPSSVLAHLLLSLLTFCPWSPVLAHAVSLISSCRRSPVLAQMFYFCWLSRVLWPLQLKVRIHQRKSKKIRCCGPNMSPNNLHSMAEGQTDEGVPGGLKGRQRQRCLAGPSDSKRSRRGQERSQFQHDKGMQ